MSNVHEGHRERMRDKYINEGLDGFEDHELLELLLYYCIPRRDTNVLAHSMINEFGSLTLLFEADPKEIARRCKVSDNTAVLVSMIPSLANRYFINRWEQRGIEMSNSQIAGDYAIDLFAGKNVEVFYVMCLNSKKNLIHTVKISEGTVDEIPIYIREICKAVISYRATNVILAHNHPGGTNAPSLSDRETTKKIIQALEYMNVDVIDHIIVAGNKYYSFALKGLLGLGY